MSPFLTDCWTLLSVCAPGCCVMALGELQGILVGAACPVHWEASLLLCNFVNRAKSYVQVEYANMEFLF